MFEQVKKCSNNQNKLENETRKCHPTLDIICRMSESTENLSKIDVTNT